MCSSEAFGESSYLGEVWYAEADTPVGPWAYARKIVTHNKIFFEGTYSHTFSGSPETATPCYDYNQIMYRLNLDDPRLILPVPVYQIRNKLVESANSFFAHADRWTCSITLLNPRGQSCCHPERSEGSQRLQKEILHCAMLRSE